MPSFILGVSIFVGVAGIANILQSVFKLSYTRNPVLFIFLYLSTILLAGYTANYIPNLSVIFSLIIISVMYITFVHLLFKYWKPSKQLYRADTISEPYEGLVKPKLSGQFVKICELLLQDVSAWLIVGGLLLVSDSLAVTVIIFTALVCILHIPGLWLFGKFYGGYFLILSSVLAFCVPLVYHQGTYGFIGLFLLHTAGYMFMYYFFGKLSTLLSPSNKFS